MRETRGALAVAAHTLGCKVNQYDTDRLLAELLRHGCKIVGFNEPADVYIINTCTVTRTGESKSLQFMRRVKKEHPGAALAVCGCLIKSDEDAVKNTGADIIFDARVPEQLTSKLKLMNKDTVPPVFTSPSAAL